MIVLDVNVVLAAYLDGHPFHAAANKFLEESLAAGGVAVPDVVWSGFMRIATHPATTTPPVEWPDIRAFIAAVRGHPGYRADVRAMSAPLDSFVALCQATGARGNKISDAYIAGVAIDHNAPVATLDTDFDQLPVAVIHPPLPEPKTHSSSTT